MSVLIETKLGEVLVDRASRKKFEYLVSRDINESDPVTVFSLAVHSLFEEFVLENIVDLDEPWCLVSVLHVYSRFIDSLDDIQSTHRSHLVKKLNSLVAPLCTEATHNGSGNVITPCFGDVAKTSLLEWLMMIEYEHTDTPESLARLWDYIATHPDESIQSMTVPSKYFCAGKAEKGALSVWYTKNFCDMFATDLDRRMFDLMVRFGKLHDTPELVAYEAVDSLFAEVAMANFIVPEESWCVIAMMSVYCMFGDNLTSRQEQHYLLLVNKLNRLVEPYCHWDTRNSYPASSASSLITPNNLQYWLSRISVEETDTPSSLAAYWDRISGNVFQQVPSRFHPSEFNPSYGHGVKIPILTRAESVH